MAALRPPFLQDIWLWYKYAFPTKPVIKCPRRLLLCSAFRPAVVVYYRNKWITPSPGTKMYHQYFRPFWLICFTPQDKEVTIMVYIDLRAGSHVFRLIYAHATWNQSVWLESSTFNYIYINIFKKKNLREHQVVIQYSAFRLWQPRISNHITIKWLESLMTEVWCFSGFNCTFCVQCESGMPRRLTFSTAWCLFVGTEKEKKNYVAISLMWNWSLIVKLHSWDPAMRLLQEFFREKFDRNA